MHSLFDDVLSKVSVRPQATDGSGAVDGAAVDTKGYDTLMAVIEIGAAAGSPVSFTVDAKLQSSADGSTGWADTGIAMTQATAGSKSAQLRLDNLMDAYAASTVVNRYVRVVVTAAFTGGTTPTIPVSANVLLSRYTFGPVSNSSTPA